MPLHLGANTLSRENWLEHNTLISKNIFETNDNQLILAADGTYCYCQKSFNNAFQRKTFSVQKSRHLVKPFIICTTDGLIVDIYGLYEATQNDASILLNILKTDEKLGFIIKDNDIFVIDRGFRDCVKV